MKPKIVIVGAGAAGIAAATRLIDKGFDVVVVLEAENRFGGRISTIPFASNVVDLRAQWCHGEKGNVVFDLASKHNLLHDTKDEENDFILTQPNGDQLSVATTDDLMELLHSITHNYEEEMSELKGSLGDFITNKYWSELESPIYESVTKTVASQVLDWYHRCINAYSGCNTWFEASAHGDTLYLECDGDPNLNWKGGGCKLVFDLLANKIPEANERSIDIENYIQLNKKVTNISWAEELTITCGDGSKYEADHVIVTTSLGVLQENYETLFTPALPAGKINAIKGLTFGVVDKLFLEWEYPFWPEDWDSLNLVWDENGLEELERRNAKWIRGIMSFETVNDQPNVLMGWITGDHAREMELQDENEVFGHVLALIRQFLPGMTVPDPIRVLRTTWYANENFRGSYSFRSVVSDELNAFASDLAYPLTNAKSLPVVQFAGEATHDHFFSTVHGAIESGWREADRIDDIYR